MSGGDCIGGGGWCPEQKGAGLDPGLCTGGTPLNRLTDTTENITFPQLRWRPIIRQINKSNTYNYGSQIVIENYNVTILFVKAFEQVSPNKINARVHTLQYI